MKKLFLGLGLASLALLAACGGKKDDKKETTTINTVAAKTDDTDLTKYTATTASAIYSSVKHDKIYTDVAITYYFYFELGEQTDTITGTCAYQYMSAFQSWEFTALGSTSGAIGQKDDVESYNFGKHDGLYYEYNQLNSYLTTQSYETANWYTKNGGGYRLVAIDNNDSMACKMEIEWDQNGYRTACHFINDHYNDENVKGKKDFRLTYSFSSQE